MKTLVTSFSLVVVFAASPVSAQPVVPAKPQEPLQQAALPDEPDKISLSGPRVGMTFLSDGVVARLRKECRSGRCSLPSFESQTGETDFEVGSIVSQFGWQFEKRFYSGNNGLTGVAECVLLLGGLEQGVVLPSATVLVGLRSSKGLEFAVGPNVTPVGTAIAVAAGMTFRSGRLHFPVNLAVVPSKSGVRVSLLVGFNARRS